MRVVSLIAILLCTAATAAGLQCGRMLGGKMCPGYECCSSYGWCDIAPAHCEPQKGCQSYCWTNDGGAKNVIAKAAYYDPKQINWNLTTAHVACASVDGNKLLEWRSKFGWAAFCGPVGPDGSRCQDACGKCLMLVNYRKTGPPYPYQAVRVVDACTTCRDVGLVLDHEVFKNLDYDGEGARNTYLTLDYHFIACEDGTDQLHSIV